MLKYIIIAATSGIVVSAIAVSAILTNDRVSNENYLCANDTVIDYGETGGEIFLAGLEVERCLRYVMEGDDEYANEFCVRAAEEEPVILAAVPCLREAIRKDRELGIADLRLIRRTERYLNEYLANRNDHIRAMKMTEDEEYIRVMELKLTEE